MVFGVCRRNDRVPHEIGQCTYLMFHLGGTINSSSYQKGLISLLRVPIGGCLLIYGYLSDFLHVGNSNLDQDPALFETMHPCWFL